MHPDLFIVVYRQQERELEHHLEHVRSQATRPGTAGGRRRAGGLGHLGPVGALAARTRRRH